MEFKLANFQILLSEEVLLIFANHIQHTQNQPESGGILLGQVLENKLFVLKATTPNKNDRALRFLFLRDKTAAQKIVNNEFYKSKKKTIYMGEWHTHPESYPTPSCQDRLMIHEQYHKGVLNESFLLLVIIGLKGIFVGLYDGNTLTNVNLKLPDND